MHRAVRQLMEHAPHELQRTAQEVATRALTAEWVPLAVRRRFRGVAVGERWRRQ